MRGTNDWTPCDEIEGKAPSYLRPLQDDEPCFDDVRDDKDDDRGNK